jgi:hypothetical protein
MASKKSNYKLDLVSLSPALKKLQAVKVVEDELKEKLSELSGVDGLLHDPHLLLHIMNLVENVSKVALVGADKKQMVIKLLIQMFPILNSEADLKRIDLLIEFICAQGLVKRVEQSIVLKKQVSSYFLKA